MTGYYDIADILAEEEESFAHGTSAHGACSLDASDRRYVSLMSCVLMPTSWQKVPVTLRVTLPGIGLQLDPSTTERDVSKSLDEELQQGSRLELPFWILPMFLERRYVNVLDHRKFGNKLRKEVQADAACVNLRVVTPFFYTFGLKLTTVVPDKLLGLFLFMTFVERYGEVLVKCLSSSEQEMSRVKPLFSKEELDMVEAGQNSLARLQEWQQRLHTTIKASSVLGRSASKRAPPLEEIDTNSQRVPRSRQA